MFSAYSLERLITIYIQMNYKVKNMIILSLFMFLFLVITIVAKTVVGNMDLLKDEFQTDNMNIIYEEILELKRNITMTNILTKKDLSLLRDNSDYQKEIRYMKSMLHDYQIQLEFYESKSEMKSDEKISYRMITKRISYITNEIQKLRIKNTNKENFIKKLMNIYKEVLYPSKKNTIVDKDILIIGLEILTKNIEYRQRLGEIFKKYHNETNVVNILSTSMIENINNS